MLIQNLTLKKLAPQVMLLEVNVVEMCRKALLLMELQVCIYLLCIKLTIIIIVPTVDCSGDTNSDLGKVSSSSRATRGKCRGKVQKSTAPRSAPGVHIFAL